MKRKLRICEYIGHLKSNLFVALLVSVMAMMTWLLVSLLYYQYTMYRPLDVLDVKQGYYVATGGSNVKYSDVAEVANIYRIYQTEWVVDQNATTAIGYEDWAWKEYEPIITEGKWFEDDSEEQFSVVLAGNTGSYRVGDTIQVSRASGEPQEARVIGMVSDTGMILYDDCTYHASDCNYSVLYHTAEEISNGMVILFVKERAPEDLVRSWSYSGMAIIEYEEDADESIVSGNNNYLYRQLQGAGVDFTTYLEDSEEVLHQKLWTYIPVLVVAFVVVLTAVIAVSYLTVIKSRRNLAIYRFLGASRWESLGIIFGNVLWNTLISWLLLLFERVVLAILGAKYPLIRLYNGIGICVIAVIYGIYWIGSITCYVAYERKKTIKELYNQGHK